MNTDPAYIEFLYATLSTIYPITPDFKEELSKELFELEIYKGEILLRSGQKPTGFWFILEGSFRSFQINKKTESSSTTWFWKKGDFIFPFVNPFKIDKAMESIEALEQSFVFTISFEKLNQWFISHDEIAARYRNEILGAYLANRHEYFENIIHYSSKDNYKNLMSSRPDLLLTTNLNYIASFLKITREQLSRIRKR